VSLKLNHTLVFWVSMLAIYGSLAVAATADVPERINIRVPYEFDLGRELTAPPNLAEIMCRIGLEPFDSYSDPVFPERWWAVQVSANAPIDENGKGSGVFSVQVGVDIGPQDVDPPWASMGLEPAYLQRFGNGDVMVVVCHWHFLRATEDGFSAELKSIYEFKEGSIELSAEDADSYIRWPMKGSPSGWQGSEESFFVNSDPAPFIEFRFTIDDIQPDE